MIYAANFVIIRLQDRWDRYLASAVLPDPNELGNVLDSIVLDLNSEIQLIRFHYLPNKPTKPLQRPRMIASRSGRLEPRVYPKYGPLAIARPS